MRAARRTAIGVALAAAFAAGSVQAGDAERGRQLYETHCGGCHYERVHDRDPGRSDIRTLDALRAEVTRWAAQTRQRFTRDDIEDLVAYLNRSHYRLER